MVLVHGIRLPVQAPAEEAPALALQKLGLGRGEVRGARLHKVSVDARRACPVMVYSVAVEFKDAARERAFERMAAAAPNEIQVIAHSPFQLRPGAAVLPGPVVVCGLGPAGLFCALELAAAGYAPLVLERGPGMARRRAAVDAFEAGGPLNVNANIQFGEGGAGTFSDGKLATRIRDALCARVTQHLLKAGAPEEIAWKNRPHIGTDRLRDVLCALRRKLQALGGTVLFDTQLTGLVLQNGALCAVNTQGGTLPCGVLVMACGHSARDTFSTLADAGVLLQAKGFAVGLRIEHLQADIDTGLYHGAAGHPALPPGEYRLAAQCAGRGVYTFCMCPGGSVVAAASEEGGVVTNGMSLHARAGQNANAAVVAGVAADDFGGDPFEAIRFQRALEQAAFAAGGGGYTAPAETQGSFLQGAGRLALGRVQPTYTRGVAAADLGALLPAHLAGALRAGLQSFGRKLPGFGAADAVLTGLETRTSSPVRMPRRQDGESTDIGGLYPCGEGAGHAGGIISAAVDGIKTAAAIAGRYAPPK